jgi:iron complex outermembrane recepter protein
MISIFTAGAVALAASDASAEADRDPIVVTGTRLPEGAAEVLGRPGGADLVAGHEYKDKVAVSLRDALAFSPGVYSQPRFGQEVRLSIRGSGISRGFHMRGLTLLQDGVPINLADDNGDFQELDPTLLDRLEVYRGANAFRFGGTTLGGAINGVTPTGRTSRGVRLRADGGSFGTARASLTKGFADGPIDGWAGVALDRSNGDRDHSDRSAARLNANLGWAFSDAVQTRFYVNANHLRQELPGALTYDVVTRRPKSGNRTGDQARDIDSLRLQNRTTARLADLDVEGGAFLSVKSLYHPIFQAVDQESVDRGLFARMGWRTANLSLLTGVTARFGTVDSKRFINVDGKRGARTFDADQSARTIDVYGEGRLDLGQVTAIAGAIVTSGRRRQEQVFPFEATGSSHFTQFSPRAGLLWEPRKELQFYANVSRSHELPGFIELAQVASFVPLDPQHAWTAEIGGRGSVGPLSFDLSLYHASVRNELLQYRVGPDIPASTFNADKTLHRGVEAGAELALTQWAKARATYQYNDFRFIDDASYGENRLPVVPKHLLRTEVRFSAVGATVAPNVEWVPHGPWSDYANSFRAKGYALLNLSGSVAVTPTTELFLDARNLLGRKAAGDVSAVIDFSALAPAQRAIFFPVERRALFVGARARL